MKKKPIILVSLMLLILLMIVSIITVGKPQQAGTKAQSLGDALQCTSDGNFVTDQASCSGPTKEIVSVVNTGPGGDTSSVQVCCKNIVVNITTPTPAKSCPGDTTETAEAECPAGSIVTPISPLATDGDIYVRPGIVCCRKDVPTPTTDQVPPTATPPNSCPTPEVAISISNVRTICPGDCTTQ